MSNDLQTLRKKIDSIDEKLLELIGDRIKLMEEIGKIKKQLQLPVHDPSREKEKIEIINLQAKKSGIPAELVNKIWKDFFEISDEVQK